MSLITDRQELTNLRYSCRLVASVFLHIEKFFLTPGTMASTINQFIIDFCTENTAKPSFLGYKGYAFACNFSIDNEVTHAFPSSTREVPLSGLLKIDIGINYHGMISDQCKTFVIGAVSPQAQQLSNVCQEAMRAGIEQVKAGARLGDIGNAIDYYAKKNGYGNVRVLGGHGVGKALHDDPWIPHYGKAGKGAKLFANQVITIEPMFNLGTSDVVFDQQDGWTVRTSDGSLSAQWEHTILVTPTSHEVLTLIEDDQVIALTEKIKEKYQII